MCAVGRARAGGDEAEDDEAAEEEVRSREIIAEELERGKTTMETFDSMHDLALAGTATIAAYMRGAAVSRTKALARARAGKVLNIARPRLFVHVGCHVAKRARLVDASRRRAL